MVTIYIRKNLTDAERAQINYNNRCKPSWSIDMVSDLNKYLSHGLSVTQIAMKMKIGRGAVAGKIARLKLR